MGLATINITCGCYRATSSVSKDEMAGLFVHTVGHEIDTCSILIQGNLDRHWHLVYWWIMSLYRSFGTDGADQPGALPFTGIFEHGLPPLPAVLGVALNQSRHNFLMHGAVFVLATAMSLAGKRWFSRGCAHCIDVLIFRGNAITQLIRRRWSYGPSVIYMVFRAVCEVVMNASHLIAVDPPL